MLTTPSISICNVSVGYDQTYSYKYIKHDMEIYVELINIWEQYVKMLLIYFSFTLLSFL